MPRLVCSAIALLNWNTMKTLGEIKQANEIYGHILLPDRNTDL